MGNTPLSGWIIGVCILATFVMVNLYYRRDGPCTQLFLEKSAKESKEYIIISYPPDLGNAQQLVLKQKLRSSKPVSIAPINLNYTNIKFSNETMKCSSEHEKTFSILILIKTRPSEVKNRLNLRKALQNQTNSLQLDAFVQYGFLIGQSKDDITEEIAEHDDFVIGDFADTYHNLTFKSMMGLKWAMEHCQNFNFYVSLDVDTYLILNNLVTFLKDPQNYPNTTDKLKFDQALSSHSDFYAGNIFTASHPIRRNSSKWYLSEEDYPSSVFPPYIAGMAIIFSKETIANFYFLSPYVKHMTIDDVYLGILANKLGIAPTDISKLMSYGHGSDKNLTTVLTIHGAG